MNVGRNDPCPCRSGKKYKKCCLNKSVDSGTSTASGGMRYEKIMDVGTSHPVVARLGLGMFEIIDFSNLALKENEALKAKMFEAIRLLVNAENAAQPLLSEVSSQLKKLEPSGIREDEKGEPMFDLCCTRLSDSKAFFEVAHQTVNLTLSILNLLWVSNFSQDTISAMPAFVEKKFGKDHVIHKLIQDDFSWLLNLVGLIQYTKGTNFGFKDFQLSEKDSNGKYHLTLPSFLDGNGTQIANSIETYAHSLFTFLEEMTAFSLLPHFDPRLIIVEIPEAKRNKDAAVRFKVGVKPGVDIQSFKGDPKFEKIYRSSHQLYHARDEMRQQKFGRIRPIISTPFKGQMTVVVHSTVYRGKWVTFTDFLYDYLKMKFGKDWWLAEVKKPELTCCPVINWARRLQEHQKSKGVWDGNLFSADPNGPMMAYYSLAYDLFVLEDNKSLQDSLLDRMRKPDRKDFWGARYEAMVAATLIKAGFDLQFEDEDDNRKKHPEFIAMHRDSGEQIDVEAKKRNRVSVPQTEDEIRLNITDLLRNAMKKNRGRPFVIFLELDLPSIDGDPMKKPWFQELLASIDESGIRGEDGKDVCNLIVFTNYPTDHPGDASKHPPQSYIISLSSVPKVPLKNPAHLSEIVSVVNQRLKIPTWFEE